MPGFCTSCGAPLSGPFCGKCGQRAQTPASPAQSQPAAAAQTPQPSAAPIQSQPAATAQQPVPVQSQPAVAQAQPGTAPPKKSGAGKALLIIGGIILLLGVMAFAAVLYGVHWVKGKVSGLTGGAVGGTQVQVSQGNACALLSRAELQQVLGVAVERNSEIMEGNDPGCAYYTNPAAFAELQKIAVEQARRDSEKASKDPALNDSKNDNPLALLKHTEEMEGIVKGLGLTQPDAEGKVFAFTVDRNFGSENWGPLRVTMSAVPGFKDVDGVGDHAMIGSFGHAFYVLKGNSMFRLETMYVPETRVRGAELGRRIVSHL
jgi:hypothetical protein